MRLGTQTGSLTNHILSRATIGQPEPTEGMGCTILSWTDRHAGTIVGLSKARGQVILLVSRDHAKRIDSNGMSESQTYEYTRNPQGGYDHIFRQTKSGGWEQVDYNEKTLRYRKIDGGGYGLRIGERNEYHDFSF